MITVLDDVPVQPFAVVPVTVYTLDADTAILLVEAPLLQAYVLAPEAVRLIVDPPQKLPPPVILMVDNGFTVTVREMVSTHPAADVPFTLYTVFTMGDTLIEAVTGPVFQT